MSYNSLSPCAISSFKTQPNGVLPHTVELVVPLFQAHLSLQGVVHVSHLSLEVFEDGHLLYRVLRIVVKELAVLLHEGVVLHLPLRARKHQDDDILEQLHVLLLHLQIFVRQRMKKLVSSLMFHFGRKLTLTPKQIFQAKLPEDQAFKSLLQEDRESAIKQVDDDYLPEPKRGESKSPRVKENFEEKDTFITEKQKLEKTVANLGIDDPLSKQLLRQMQKEAFFMRKKQSEEDRLLLEKRKQLERKKELKKLAKELENDAPEPDKQNEEQIPYFNKMDQDEKFEQLQYWIQKFNDEGQLDQYLLQRARTARNMELFIDKYLLSSTKIFDSLKFQEAIRLGDVLTNQACTVVWVSWDFITPQPEAVKTQFLNRLNKLSPWLSWKMCQELGLKRGPEIRFILSKKKQTEEEFRKEIVDNAESLVKEDLIDRYQAKKIGPKISRTAFEHMVDVVKSKAEDIDRGTSETSRLKRQQKSEDKIIRKPSMKVETSAADDFWSKL